MDSLRGVIKSYSWPIICIGLISVFCVLLYLLSVTNNRQPEIVDAAPEVVEEQEPTETELIDQTIHAAAASLVQSAATVTFTTPTVIANGDLTHDGNDIVCDGTTLSIDGAHSYVSLSLINGCVLSHTQATANIPDLTITNDVSIDATSSINLDTLGHLGDGSTPGDGPGGGDGNSVFFGAFVAGGGAHGGPGGDGSPAGLLGGAEYDSATNPTPQMGSAGGGGQGNKGGNGGGAINFVVGGTFTNNGTITTDGEGGLAAGANSGGGGAGGGVKIEATTLAGTGTFSLDGGSGGVATNQGGNGSGGRLYIEYNTSTFPTANISADPGSAGNGGGAGSTLLIDNNGTTGDATDDDYLVPSGITWTIADTPGGLGTHTINSLTTSNASRIDIEDGIIFDVTTITLDGSAWNGPALSSLTFTDVTTFSATNSNNISVGQLAVSTVNFTLDATSTIIGDFLGFQGDATTPGDGPGGGDGNSLFFGAYVAGGGANGGDGGAGDPNGGGAASLLGGTSYGSSLNPTQMGSAGGGGQGNLGGHGGGLIDIDATGVLTLDGVIRTDGQSGVGSAANAGGGGAGGSINIVTDSLAGAGTVRANGGSGGVGTGLGGNGGGGRFYVQYNTSTFTGFTNASVIAGTAGSGGVVGTGIFLNTNNTPGTTADDEFTIVGGHQWLVADTPGGLGTFTYDEIASFNTTSVTVEDGVTFVANSLTLDNSDWFADDSSTVIYTIPTISLNNNASLEAGTQTLNTTTLTLTNTSTLLTDQLTVNATIVSLDATSSFDGDSRGFLGDGATAGDGPGGGDGNSLFFGSYAAGGGAYGGGGADGDPNGSGSSSLVAGVFYGSALNPAQRGSAGGGGQGLKGGDGGGFMDLNITGTFTLNGTLTVNGEAGLATGANAGGGGAGGGINVDTNVLTGAGTIQANGGSGGVDTGLGGKGSGGRIIVRYDSSSFTGFSNTSVDPGAAGGGTAEKGTAAFINQKGTVPTTDDEITIYEGWQWLASDSNANLFEFEDVFINDGTVRQVDTGLTLNFTGSDITLDNTIWSGDPVSTMTFTNMGTMTLQNSSSIQVGELSITGQNVSIDATSSFNGDAKGFLGDDTTPGDGPGGGDGNSLFFGNYAGGGGAYGGDGGDGSGSASNLLGGDAYGSVTAPIQMGSAGGAGQGFTGGNGGGRVQVTLSGSFTLNGDITMDGSAGAASGTNAGGGGSGGAVNIVTSSYTGSGSVTVNGGSGGVDTALGGRGGGGRISITADSFPSGISYESFPGPLGNGGAGGTVYLKETAASFGDFLVSNNNIASPDFTPLFVTGGPTSYTFHDFSVINQADLLVDLPCAGSALTINGTTDLSGGGVITNNQGGSCTVTMGTLNINPASIPGGAETVAYSESVTSDGGFAPKTYECLDGLGGSVIACNAAAGLPSGVTMSTAGLVSGTPGAAGNYSFIVRVTDSDPGGAVIDEETVTFFVSGSPSEPTLVSPADASSVNTPTPILSAQYIDPDTGDVGTTEYRVSSGSAGDCLSNTNIVDSGTSAVTATENEATTFTVTTSLAHLSTYNWCARNNDGILTSNSGNFTTMGSFLVDLGGAPNQPTIVAPGDTDTTNLLSPLLEANYSDPDPGDVGTIDFRVSSGSAGDCLSNTNIVFSGSSALTSTNNETASVTVGIALTNLATYNWCARSNDGIFTSNSGNFTTMGSFLVDTSFTPGGGVGTILQNQQAQQQAEQDSDDSSETITQPSEDDPQIAFGMNLGITDINGSPIVRPTPLSEVVFVEYVVQNVSAITGQNVFVNMTIPNHTLYIPGSLQVDGEIQSDAADGDAGQGNDNAVSAIWPVLNPGEAKIVTFQLIFNRTSLVEFAQTQVQASANPVLTLQMSASADNGPAASSNIIELEPDISSLIPEPVEEPVVEPIAPETSEPETPETPVEPIPAPVPEPEPSTPLIQEPVPVDPPVSELEPAPTPLETISEPIELGGSEGSETNAFSDGQTFSIEVVDNEQEQQLFVTGNAETQEDTIEFGGTTSEPNATVTIILNNDLTLTVTSDENGQWQTFVNAESLGILEGQAAEVSVNAIASKGDVRSDQVSVGTILVDRSIPGELIAEFEEPEVLAETPVQAIVNQVQEVIKEQEEEIQTTLAVAAPVVVVSSAPLWGYLPYLPTMGYHFITWIIGLLGRKKKEDQRIYGIVYDSISKEPIPLAIVRIYKLLDSEPGVHDDHARQLVSTVVTDKQGRYEALLDQSDYEIEVKKPQFTFPSAIIKVGPDGEYTNIYSGALTVEPSTSQPISVPDIPIDPENAPKKWQTGNVFKRIWLSLQKVGHALAVPTLFIGAIAGVLVLLADPSNPLNWILSILYILMLVMQLTFRTHTRKAWGIVYDVATSAALPLATLQLIDPEFGKVVKSRLSDYEGRFSFLPEPGKYIIKATKEGYQQTEVIESDKQHNPISGEIEIQKEGERIDGDIPLTQL